MLKKARARGLADYIFLNEKNEVTEGCISNIFLKIKNKLITPPISCGLLNGTMRSYILKSKKNVEEKIITVEELKTAGEIYLSNSVTGLRKVIICSNFPDRI